MKDYNFNEIIDQIIEKSLFTRRQIEILLSETHQDAQTSAGSYYRQRSQVRRKTESLIYTAVLLRALGVLSQNGLSMMEEVAMNISVIFDSDIEQSSDILEVLEKIVKRSVVM